MFLRKEGGEKFTLVLRGVERFQGEDFRQGNIIFDVVFLEPDELEVSDLCELYPLSAESLKTFSLADWSAKARAEGLKAVQISPSYGCSIQALYRTHELITGYQAFSNDQKMQAE